MNEEKLKLIAAGLRMIAEALDPARVEPAKVEPAKVEPAKVEPAKVEPAKVEPAKVEPAKVEPAKVEPAKAEPAKVEPAKAEPAKVEPAKAEPAKLKLVKKEPVEPETVDFEALRSSIREELMGCKDLAKSREMVLSFKVKRLSEIPDSSLAALWAKMVEGGIVKLDGRAVEIGADAIVESLITDPVKKPRKAEGRAKKAADSKETSEPELTHEWFAKRFRACNDRAKAKELIFSLGARLLGDVKASQYKELYNLSLEAGLLGDS